MRFIGLLPLALAIDAFILGLLCLLAGYKPDFMQGYDIITLNSSSLGHNIIDTSSTSSATSPTATSFLSSISSLADDVADEIEDKLGDAINDVSGYLADKLAAELGIQQWYNLHLMTLCEGNYKPNATAKGASKNVTKCSKARAMYDFNITSRLESELSIGPFNLSLEDIGYPTERINAGIRDLNLALHAMFILYCIGIAMSVLLVLAAAVYTLGHHDGTRHRRHLTALLLLDLLPASVGALAYLIGSIIITVLQKKAAHLINKYGNAVGLYATRGTGFLALSWTATTALLVAWLVFLVELCRCCCKGRRGGAYRSGQGEKARGTRSRTAGMMVSRWLPRRKRATTGVDPVVESRSRSSI